MKVYSDGGFYYGELNAKKKLHGRGVVMWVDESITLAYWNNDERAIGNYIQIDPKASGFYVGQCNTIKDGELNYKWTLYKSDGSTQRLGYDDLPVREYQNNADQKF